MGDAGSLAPGAKKRGPFEGPWAVDFSSIGTGAGENLYDVPEKRSSTGASGSSLTVRVTM
jgi:hypothetical protein